MSPTIRDLLNRVKMQATIRVVEICGGIKIKLYQVYKEFYVIVSDPNDRWILVARDMNNTDANDLFDTLMKHFGGDNG